MHMEHVRAVLDAAHLKQGQHVLMVSGRAAKVSALKSSTILFEYLDSGRTDDVIEIPRWRVPEFVRV